MVQQKPRGSLFIWERRRIEDQALQLWPLTKSLDFLIFYGVITDREVREKFALWKANRMSSNESFRLFEPGKRVESKCLWQKAEHEQSYAFLFFGTFSSFMISCYLLICMVCQKKKEKKKKQRQQQQQKKNADVGMIPNSFVFERKFQDKGLEAPCREKPWRSPGSNLRHQIA